MTCYECGPPLPKVTEANALDIQAHWDAYLDHWVDALHDGSATWWELAQTFKHMARIEEFLASALLCLAERTAT